MIDNDLTAVCSEFLKCIHSADLSPAELAGVLGSFSINANQLFEALGKLPEYYDLTSEGMRRIIELYIAEFIDLFRDTDRPQIYATHPAPLYAMMLVGNAGKESVRIKTPELVAMLVLRSFFGWKGKVKGTWETGCTYCGLNQMRLYLIENKCIAPPEVLWNWSLLCDENYKTNKLIEEYYPEISRIDITQIRKYYSEEARFCALSEQIEQALSKIKQELGIHMNDIIERQTWNHWLSLVLTIKAITEINNNMQGQLLGGNDLALVQSVLLTAFSNWVPVLDAVKLLLAEMKDKKKQIEHCRSRYSKERCLYCYYVPLTTPEVSSLFTKCGIKLIGNTAFLSRNIEEHSQKNLNEKIAFMCMQILIGNDCKTEAEEVCKQLKEYQCSGYLTGMYAYDKWLGGKQGAIAELIEKKSGYPVFFLDMDFWNNNDLKILEHKIKKIAEMIV